MVEGSDDKQVHMCKTPFAISAGVVSSGLHIMSFVIFFFGLEDLSFK